MGTLPSPNSIDELYEYANRTLTMWIGFSERQDRKALAAITILGVLSGATLLSMPADIQTPVWMVTLYGLHLLILGALIGVLILCVSALSLGKYEWPDNVVGMVKEHEFDDPLNFKRQMTANIGDVIAKLNQSHESKATRLKWALNIGIPTVTALIVIFAFVRTIYVIDHPKHQDTPRGYRSILWVK